MEKIKKIGVIGAGTNSRIYTYIIIAAFILMILVSLFAKGAAGEKMPEKMKLLFKHAE